MEKLNKVIDSLRCCNDDPDCESCCYRGLREDGKTCLDLLLEDALGLLRKVCDLEIHMEVTRMNLGDTREECNRLEYENEELKRKYEAAVEMAAIATERAAARTGGDLISRAELMKYPIRWDHYDRENGNEHFVLGIESVLEYAEYLPAVDAELVVHAHWICDCEPYHICSNCRHKFSLFDRVPRCPNCGAKMDEEISE